jgi:hypothetical protein
MLCSNCILNKARIDPTKYSTLVHIFLPRQISQNAVSQFFSTRLERGVVGSLLEHIKNFAPKTDRMGWSRPGAGDLETVSRFISGAVRFVISGVENAWRSG